TQAGEGRFRQRRAAGEAQQVARGFPGVRRRGDQALGAHHQGKRRHAGMSPRKAPGVSQPRDLELIVEKDVRIPMRDGAVLLADVFRPANETENETEGGEEKFPAIMNISVYQKDKLWVPPADLEEG